LEALLGRPLDAPVVENSAEVSRLESLVEAAPVGERIAKISVYQIDSNPYQPRRDFTDEDLQELAESLDAHGLLQPLVVRKVDDRYQLIAGERRLRAAIKAGWAEVPVQIREINDREMAELAIVENLQRKDLNSLEKAVSFQQYLHQYSCTQEELASRLKIDRSTISNLIRLLELPHPVQDALRRGAITQGHARALLPLGGEVEQIAFCQRIQQEGLSVRATEDLVSDAVHESEREPLLDSPQPARSRPVRARKSQQLNALEQELRHALGTRVDVRLGKGERGRIVVHFSTHEEFERLRDCLTNDAPMRRAG
jgi:ParB family chromosome partitioning protein